ncbi:hypothetical protein CAK95_22690 [Pseudorhodoplanes sinuspersici]|uniref:Uncharacterized protein n=2 Tax=Pseudorhodoplanes sinuspersici TaxID=1235591 RepID=A0A1W6ZWE4_9HYPH|nr:hypothetical protein CAK95_22690 [Pseudorhodoplanes sinuspersici]
MADIAEFQDLVTPLRDVREEIERQLQETREYRALCAIDNIVPQLADVLAFLDENSNVDMPSPGTEQVVAEPDPVTSSDIQIVAADARADELAVAEEIVELVDSGHVVSEPQGVTINPVSRNTEPSAVPPEDVSELLDAPFPIARDDMSEDVVSGPQHVPATADASPPASDHSAEETASPPVATLAYNLANMLVQSLPPATSDAKTAPVDTQAGLAATTHADHAVQEGRAA